MMNQEMRDGVIMDVEAILDNISCIRVLHFNNHCLDVQMFDIQSVEELNALIIQVFGSLEATTHQQLATTVEQCPAMKFILSAVQHEDKPVNYKLQSFAHRLQLRGVFLRCENALAIGLSGMATGACMVDIPSFLFDMFCQIPYQMGTVDLRSLQLLGEELESVFEMKHACEYCSKAKRICSKIYPCKECKHRGLACAMSYAEITTRARTLYSDIFAGGVPHNDIAKIQLVLQMPAGRYKLRPRDIKDIESRIGVRTFVNRRDMKNIPGKVPEQIRQFISGQLYWKIEWMTHGIYQLRASQGYGNTIFNPNNITSIGVKHKIPFKLADTSNMAVLSSSYRLWIESINNPGTVIRYEGKALDGSTRILKVCTVLLYDSYTMVTATIVE